MAVGLWGWGACCLHREETAFLEASCNPVAPAPTCTPPCFLKQSRGMRRGGRFRADGEERLLTLSRGQPGPPWAPWGRSVFLHRGRCPLAVVPAGWRRASGTTCLPPLPPPRPQVHPLGSEPSGCLRNQSPASFLFTGDTQKPRIWTVRRTARSCVRSSPRKHFWGATGSLWGRGAEPRQTHPKRPCVLSPPGHAGPAGSCAEAVLKVWSSGGQPHLTRALSGNTYSRAAPRTRRIRTLGLGLSPLCFNKRSR